MTEHSPRYLKHWISTSKLPSQTKTKSFTLMNRTHKKVHSNLNILQFAFIKLYSHGKIISNFC